MTSNQPRVENILMRVVMKGCYAVSGSKSFYHLTEAVLWMGDCVGDVFACVARRFQRAVREPTEPPLMACLSPNCQFCFRHVRSLLTWALGCSLLTIVSDSMKPSMKPSSATFCRFDWRFNSVSKRTADVRPCVSFLFVYSCRLGMTGDIHVRLFHLENITSGACSWLETILDGTM